MAGVFGCGSRMVGLSENADGETVVEIDCRYGCSPVRDQVKT
jgi:hypothetical protein